MMKGGFHPESRLGQGLAEIQVGAVVYGQLDRAEDALVDDLLTRLRTWLANSPWHIAELEGWEQRWRSADRIADQSVIEIGAVAVQAGGYLGAVAIP